MSELTTTYDGAERRPTIVSFSREKDEEVSLEGSEEGPGIEEYLDHAGERLECCGICLPIPFERAHKRSWWDPKFDSEILEGQYRQSAFPQIRLRFRYALVYMLIVSLSWCAYLIVYGVRDKSQKDAFPLGVIFFLFSVFCGIILLLTRSQLYRRYQFPVSLLTSVSMCLLSLASVGSSPVLSPAGDFAICIEILIIIYTVIPLPLYLCAIIGVLYSTAFEIYGSKFTLPFRILSHVCVHLIALHILIMTNVRMRGTFMKVGQSLLVRKQLEKEKQLKEKMIDSVMPKEVSNWLMDDNNAPSSSSGGNIQSHFRPFNMDNMKNVSILFADIVGFTRMSSNKSASELVAVLNDLFERFDHLCTKNGCEKISTLGDCYYCVSGCPTPRKDHAHCCVQMGLDMIDAIVEFDEERHEEVNMRVGVHTGTVLCGIVGTLRFKFDVWSNDVTLANKMESTGKPGRVHISQVTKDFLNDEYILEPGDIFHGNETYFIVGPKEIISSQPSSNQMTITSPTPTGPSEPSVPFVSCESALTNQTKSNSQSLMTAYSQPKSNETSQRTNMNKSQSSSVHCTVSPFDKLDDSEIFGPEDSANPQALSTPSSPTPLPARTAQMIPRLLCLKSSDMKATSLPSILNQDAQTKIQSNNSLSIIPTKKALWKYTRLKISKKEVENGKVQQTFKSLSLQSDPSSMEKYPSNQLEVPRDDLSACHSVNSRKDSGIKSNSRRSSIQPQFILMNGIAQGDLLAQRVSGYYTSSQSSINNDTEKGINKGTKLPPPLTDSLLHCQNLRKQSDLQLIKCVQDNKDFDTSSFPKSTFKPWSLLFENEELEMKYREKAHRMSPDESHRARTLATSRFNTYFDVTISLIVFASISVSSFIVFPLNIQWVTIFVVLFIIQFIVIFFCIQSIFKPTISPRLNPLLRWYPWHGIGAILVSLPLIAVLINFDKSTLCKDYFYNYSYLFFVGIVHYCNFTQLNCWMKSSLATLGAVIYLILITTTLLNHPEILNGNTTEMSIASDVLPLTTDNYDFTTDTPPLTAVYDERISDIYGKRVKRLVPIESKSNKNSVDSITDLFIFGNAIDRSKREILDEIADTNSTITDGFTLRSDSFIVEIFLDVFLLVLLVWFLNREFEISYRLSFYLNALAAQYQSAVEKNRNQADLLLHNIIPRYVVNQLKKTARYSEDVKDVGIIFASIVNFSEMYDESFSGGKECLRVLNELVGDFDELLSRPEFSMVEKIKTIGATFMAASGLNSTQRVADSKEHLFQLMDFAFALLSVIDNFNAHLLEFKFVLRVGYNFGDVTAGVIGTTKLYYDIWGDAVNIASRMDSTGVHNSIQVPARCLEVLSERYELTHRGTVFVKGKDMMDVYLVVSKKVQENTRL